MTNQRIFETFKNREAVAYVVSAVMNGGKDFTSACNGENLYGNREDIVADRDTAAFFLRRRGFTAEYIG